MSDAYMNNVHTAHNVREGTIVRKVPVNQPRDTCARTRRQNKPGRSTRWETVVWMGRMFRTSNAPLLVSTEKAKNSNCRGRVLLD